MSTETTEKQELTPEKEAFRNTRKAVARALWMADYAAEKGEDADAKSDNGEARKAAWLENRQDYARKASVFINLMKRRGIELTLTEKAAELAEDD